MNQIEKAITKHLYVDDELEEIKGIPEATAEIEGMNCGNCKELNPFDVEEHDPMCKHHRMRISEFTLNIFKCNDWEAAK